MDPITLVPVGDVDAVVLGRLRLRLADALRAEVHVAPPMPMPTGALDARRGQWLSTAVLGALEGMGLAGIALAVANVDLYVPSLNFVFGEASLGGGSAVVSLARLRPAFYGLPEDEALLLERALKEAVHELGHALGLPHCPDPRCVMRFSNSLADTDRKGSSFCARCAGRLGR